MIGTPQGVIVMVLLVIVLLAEHGQPRKRARRGKKGGMKRK